MFARQFTREHDDGPILLLDPQDSSVPPSAAPRHLSCAWQNCAFTASRRHTEDFDLAMTRVSAAGELIDTMMSDYGDYGTRTPFSL